jgi:hypothetical protein
VLSGSKLFFKTQANVVQVAVGISCDAAAFGKASIWWPVPEEAQGKEVSIDVAASVKYPTGRGRLLRFRDGLRVGAVGADLWREGIRMIGALSGTPERYNRG